MTDLEQIIATTCRTTLPAIFLLVDSERRITEVNQHTRDLLGPAVVGAKFADLVVNFQQDLDPYALASEAKRHSINFKTYVGLIQTVECLFSGLNGAVLIMGGPDQREQERMKADLLQLNQRLNNQRRELQKALSEVAALNALKDRFLSIAAHDLRAPLQSMLMLVNLMLDDPCERNAQERDELLLLKESAEFMAQLVDGFLDAAVIESGQLKLHRQPHSVLEVVKESVSLLGPLANRKAVSLQVESAATPPDLSVDRSKLKQTLINLINNAIQHSFPGQNVIVRVGQEDSCALVQVVDEGTGIPWLESESIFTAFVQGSRGKTSRERSVGLGLAIARMVVEAHGGTLSAAPNGQKGTVFSLRLPLPAPPV